jgi:hypothetical protein
MWMHPAYLLLLATLATGCQLRLEGAACPCLAGWSCCPGRNYCARDLASCPGPGAPGPDATGLDGPGLDALQIDDAVVDGAAVDAGRSDGRPRDASVFDGPLSDGPLPDGMVLTLAPVAPTVGHAMYQGGQTQFMTPTGTCTGRVAGSMSLTGFCYLAASDEVKCAGLIGSTDYGMSFTTTGQTGATQIMVFLLSSGMCIAKTDHTVYCVGSNTGILGDSPWPTFRQWSEHGDIAAVATGFYGQLCGITLGGQVFCGGQRSAGDYGNPPINVGPPGQTSVWVDLFGEAHLSDPGVLRPGENSAKCLVQAQGLVCQELGTFGPADGTIVMGTTVVRARTADLRTCWLAQDATVTCEYGPRFAAGKVLFLAAGFYSESLCAIYSDGSVWCIGSNQHGKLGTGNDAPLEIETMVAPPGSAHVGCDP